MMAKNMATNIVSKSKRTFKKNAGLALIGLSLPMTASAGFFSNIWDAGTNLVETVVETTVNVGTQVVETTVKIGTEVVDAGTSVVGSTIPREPDSHGGYSEAQQAMNLLDPPKANNLVDNNPDILHSPHRQNQIQI